MKFLFVTKRSPQQRDLLARPYGRFYNLPVELARRGHEVRVLLCSHHHLLSERRAFEGVECISHDIRFLGPIGLRDYLCKEALAFAPDWVIGCSDAWYGPLAKHLARKVHACLALDAYDDYEAYMPWNWPLHLAWRDSLRAADLVTAAGPQLAQLLDRHRHGRAPTIVVPMAADAVFTPNDKAESRIALGLPDGAPLVGYTGSWARNRGTDTLLEAFELVRQQHPSVRLVLTGKPPRYATTQPGVIALGYVADMQLPLVLSSLNVACVITANSRFGRFSYPSKLCEAMACRIPVVASDSEPVRWMLKDDAQSLVPQGSATELAARIVDQLSEGAANYPPPPSWADSAAILEEALRCSAQ